ncbi:MAG: hypothetical protein FJ100_22140 [Deltaproteobacteria bacterium]|nr:hypothetical protein [Deltaproteobacteria bacterium]
MPVRPLLTLALLIVGVAEASPILAEPLELAAQGRLTSSGGPAADGNYPMAVSLYEAPTGGAAVWTEFFLAVQVQGGLFSLPLGAAGQKLDSAVFANGKMLFVGVVVGADPELPRQPLRKVPYAVHAAAANWAGDLQCSGCVGADDLAKAAVTGDKIAVGAVGSNHVNFAWAAADGPGGNATFALTANTAKTAESAQIANLATFAEEAAVAKKAGSIQCTGCVGAAALAASIPADWVKAGTLAAVATSGKYADLQGGPDLTGYGALANANTWDQAQALKGGGSLGNNLDFASNQALYFRFHNATKEPVACDKSNPGLAYFNTADGNLYFCNGSKWKSVSQTATGTMASPAASCKALLDAGDATGSGKYWLKKGDGTAFHGYCEMAMEGGGWTRFLVMTDAGAFKAISGVSNSTEFVDNGTYQFSTAMLKASNREVLIVETVAPFRMHRYDFKLGDNLANDNFVGAITGDVNGSVGVMNWQTGKFEVMAAGKCNNNNHSQWNCEPPGGVRFHYGTRDWTGDGGVSFGDGNWAFTGYANGAGPYSPVNLPKYVKNWDGAFNATAHALFFR